MLTVLSTLLVDSAGNAYVTGMTGSTNFPMINAYQSFYGGQMDAFVTQYSSTGQMSIQLILEEPIVKLAMESPLIVKEIFI